MRLILTFALLLIAFNVNARAIDLNYTLPTADCLGEPLLSGDIVAMELYVDTAPIPASDLDCPDALNPVDEVPVDAMMFNEIAPDGQIKINLAPGTYFARFRLQNMEGQWSNLSDEKVIVVNRGRPVRGGW